MYFIQVDDISYTNFGFGTKNSIFDMDCSTKQTIATFVDKQIPKLLKESLET